MFNPGSCSEPTKKEGRRFERTACDMDEIYETLLSEFTGNDTHASVPPGGVSEMNDVQLMKAVGRRAKELVLDSGLLISPQEFLNLVAKICRAAKGEEPSA